MTFKKTKPMIALLLSLAFSTFSSDILSSEPTDRSQWTSNDYWEETQLSFQSLIYGIVSDANCKSDLQKLVACMAVMNKMHDLKHPSNKELIILNIEDGFSFSIVNQENLSLRTYLIELKKRLLSVIGEDGLGLLNGSFSQALADFEQFSLTELNDSKTAAILYNTYLTVAVDPHSYIIPTNQMRYRSQAKIDNKGIGVFLNSTLIKGVEKILITEVIEGSPAEKSGVKAGDVFLQINQASNYESMLKEISLTDSFNVTILRDETVISLNLSKGTYTVVNVKAKKLKSGKSVYGYIKLRSFSDPTACMRIKMHIRKFKMDSNFKGTILDLRNNGGGLVTQALCILESYLIPGSTTWMTRDLNRKELVYENFQPTRFEELLQPYHNVVLVNGYSASASEAVAMYLQDYQRAIVMGERSFGKGSMQGLMEFDRDEFGEDARGITTASTQALYYGPKGISPQVNGVLPDLKVFPKVDQIKDTEFMREEDIYAFPILDRDVDKTDLIDFDRESELKLVKSCLNDNPVKAKYDSLSKNRKYTFDNQLESAIVALDCANKKIRVHNSIDIKKTTDLEMITKYQLMRRMFNEVYGPEQVEPIKPDIDLSIKPDELEIEIEIEIEKPTLTKPDDEDDD